MLRHNWIGLLLLTLLGATVLTACWSSYMWYRGAQEAQTLEFHFQRMNNISTAVQTLANEALEYSRRHPTIDPILLEHNIRARPTSPAPSAPNAINTP